MNLEPQIANIFENNNYSDLFKIRWLYLYVCRLFSYDIRVVYAKEDLKQEICDKKIDIKRVEDFEIVCYTIARLLIDVLSVYGYECELTREYENKFSHSYVIVKCKDYILKLDPTQRHDLTRVKINSNTLDFTLLNDNPNFISELKESDSIITNDYKDIDKYVFYDKETIEKLVEVIEDSAKNRKLSQCELFYEKIEYLFSLINSRTDLKRYDDIDYYFSYLIKKFKLNEKVEVINGQVVKTKINRVKPAVFFNVDDKSMRDMINLAIIEYENMPSMLYLLKKEGENFKAREVFMNEAIELLKQYRNPACQFIFESAVLKLSPNDNGKPFGVL